MLSSDIYPIMLDLEWVAFSLKVNHSNACLWYDLNDGQDQRKLGALVVADREELRAAAKKRMQAKGSQSAEPADSDLRACIEAELRTL